jgi:hypothetical protein
MADTDGHRDARQGRGEIGAGDVSPEAQEGSDPGPSTAVRRGIAVYREMLRFEEEILQRMQSWARSQPDGIRRSVQASDIEPMERLVEQFRERLVYWQQRERQLGRTDAELT